MPDLPAIPIPQPVSIPARTWSNYFQTLLHVAPPGPNDPWPVTLQYNGYDANTGEVADPRSVPPLVMKRDLKKLLRIPDFAAAFEATLGVCIGYIPVYLAEEQIAAGLADIDAKQAAVTKATDDKAAGIAAAVHARDASVTAATAAMQAAVTAATAIRDSLQVQLADWQSALTQHNALPDDTVNKTAAIRNDEAKIADYTAQIAAANTAIATATTTGQTAITTATTAGQTAIDAATTAGQAMLDTATAALQSAQSLVWATLLAQWRAAIAPLGLTDAAALPDSMIGLTPPSL